MNGKCFSLAAAAALSILTLCGLQSCSKNNSSSSTQSNGTMTATINGLAYSAKSYVIAGYLLHYGQLVVQGDSITNKDTTEIQVAMPYDMPANVTIPIDTVVYADSLGVTCRTAGRIYEAYYNFYQSHGLVSLNVKDTITHQLTGTFSGVLYNMNNANDSLVITNGAFNSMYQVQ